MDQLDDIPKKSIRWRTLFLDSDTDTAWTMFQKERQSVTGIVTFCEKLDSLLGGGVQLGQVTEIAGPAGSGKTQLCFQLAVDVQIPKCLGGVEGSTVYIDTENCFSTNRLKQIAQAASEHCSKIVETQEEKMAAAKFTADQIFSKIICKSCRDIGELLQVANSMEEFVRVNDNVKLIVVDSVAFPFRYTDEHVIPALQRCQYQQRLKLALVRIAVRRNVAIVVTNHVTTVFNDAAVAYESTALGSNWGCDCATRLFVTTVQSQRFAYLLKSSSRMNGLVTFAIETTGIRDIKNKDVAVPVELSDLLTQQLKEFRDSPDLLELSSYDPTELDLFEEEKKNAEEKEKLS